MCFKVFASLSICLRWGQVEPIDWKPSEPLSKSLSLPVRFVPMEPSSVLQAMLQKHGRAGMMDHLRPTHKDDRQQGWVDAGDGVAVRQLSSGRASALSASFHDFCQRIRLTLQGKHRCTVPLHVVVDVRRGQGRLMKEIFYAGPLYAFPVQ